MRHFPMKGGHFLEENLARTNNVDGVPLDVVQDTEPTIEHQT